MFLDHYTRCLAAFFVKTRALAALKKGFFKLSSAYIWLQAPCQTPFNSAWNQVAAIKEVVLEALGLIALSPRGALCQSQ